MAVRAANHKAAPQALHQQAALRKAVQAKMLVLAAPALRRVLVHKQALARGKLGAHRPQAQQGLVITA